MGNKRGNGGRNASSSPWFNNQDYEKGVSSDHNRKIDYSRFKIPESFYDEGDKYSTNLQLPYDERDILKDDD